MTGGIFESPCEHKSIVVGSYSRKGQSVEKGKHKRGFPTRIGHPFPQMEMEMEISEIATKIVSTFFHRGEEIDTKSVVV